MQGVVGVVGANGPVALAWAGEPDRTLTQDLATLPHIAYARVAVGRIIDELLTIAKSRDPGEEMDRVWSLPPLD
jgi:hypothetical protein